MMSYSEQIDITPLKKAASVFERFRVDMMDDRDQAGAEQAFEFCFELSWKFLMKILNKKSVNVASPKDTIRAALKNNLIKDADL